MVCYAVSHDDAAGAGASAALSSSHASSSLSHLLRAGSVFMVQSHGAFSAGSFAPGGSLRHFSHSSHCTHGSISLPFASTAKVRDGFSFRLASQFVPVGFLEVPRSEGVLLHRAVLAERLQRLRARRALVRDARPGAARILARGCGAAAAAVLQTPPPPLPSTPSPLPSTPLPPPPPPSPPPSRSASPPRRQSRSSARGAPPWRCRGGRPHA